MKNSGCYSVIYVVDDESSRGLVFSMDYKHGAGALGNQWICSDTEPGMIHWIPRCTVPDHGIQALYTHFGLTQDDVHIMTVLTMSPANLAHIRRIKEDRESLMHKEIKSMRMVSNYPEDYADTFETVA